MKIPVFVGPTLCGEDVGVAFASHPPATEGDVYKAALKKPMAIGLIDGQFEIAPSVWHKEILWALSQGIYVFGAASIGALRAAELSAFGMIGVGRIYDDFQSGALDEDDEVTIVHAPAELAYRPLTEAMVDIRATLIAAESAKMLTKQDAESLAAVAKSLFFKDRTWHEILRGGEKAKTLPHAQALALQKWLSTNKIYRKREDAIAMLAAIRALANKPRIPFKTAFEFSDTIHWRQAIHEWSKSRPGTSNSSGPHSGRGGTKHRHIKPPRRGRA